MRKVFYGACSLGLLLMTSCVTSSSLYLEAFAPEEGGLNLVKVTDETSNIVLAGSSFTLGYQIDYANRAQGYNKENMFGWNVHRLLSVSPDGKKIAYCTRMNGSDNIMVRSANAQTSATQRTFRNVDSFSWGADGKLYFGDRNGDNCYISSVNAEAGSMMAQLTNGSVYDSNPTITEDGKNVFFTRLSNAGPSIWSLNRDNGTLTSCARGYGQCLINNNPNAFYCTRNTTAGRSEIWYVDFVKGQEILILSDAQRSFTSPMLSPDGQWLLCVGNAKSSISHKNNLDIFVVRTDGSHLTQLTYHPENDCSPAWSADGRSIYFISGRANKDKKYNIWRMNFDME